MHRFRQSNVENRKSIVELPMETDFPLGRWWVMSKRIRVAGDVKLPGHIFGQRRGAPAYRKSSKMTGKAT